MYSGSQPGHLALPCLLALSIIVLKETASAERSEAMSGLSAYSPPLEPSLLTCLSPLLWGELHFPKLATNGILNQLNL